MSINQAAGVTSFANRGLPGQVDLPVLTATGILFNDTNAINQLLNGQAGSLANTLATNRDFFCRMVGTSFEPCGSQLRRGRGLSDQLLEGQPIRHRGGDGTWTTTATPITTVCRWSSASASGTACR